MKTYGLLLCLLVSCSANALSGSWVAEGPGITLPARGSRETSPLLHAPDSLGDTPEARITTVSWTYHLLAVEPMGLEVQLCTAYRCIPLTAARGSSEGLRGEPASSALHFVYTLPASQRINLPLQVLANQVIVNYQTP